MIQDLFPLRTAGGLSLVLCIFISFPLLAREDEPSSAGEDQPAELDTLVVSAALEPLSVRDVASSITIITREEIEQRQARYLGELLRDVPGFSVSPTFALRESGDRPVAD